MGIYHRYIITDDKTVTMPEIEKVFQEINPAYTLEDGDTVMLRGELFGLIEINLQDEELFEEERAEMIEMLEDEAEDDRASRAALAAWISAKSVVVVQELASKRGHAATYEGLRPLFDWLLKNYAGLLVADNQVVINRNGVVN